MLDIRNDYRFFIKKGKGFWMKRLFHCLLLIVIALITSSCTDSQDSSGDWPYNFVVWNSDMYITSNEILMRSIQRSVKLKSNSDIEGQSSSRVFSNRYPFEDIKFGNEFMFWCICFRQTDRKYSCWRSYISRESIRSNIKDRRIDGGVTPTSSILFNSYLSVHAIGVPFLTG